MKMKLSLFNDSQIALDISFNVGFKKKQELKKAIIEHGGIVSFIVTKKCSFVVVSDPEKCDVSSKCRMAVKYCLPVVSIDYIWDCIGAGKRLPIDRYTVGGKSKSLDFRSGKISAPESKSNSGVFATRKLRLKQNFNIRSLQIWRPGEQGAPLFDEEKYEVAKYTVFEGVKKKQDKQCFYALEIHVAPSVPSSLQSEAVLPGGCVIQYKYRIYSHFGDLESVLAGKPCCTELRYVGSSDQALSAFGALYNEQITHHKMAVREGALRNVGSRKLQQILAELESETGMATPAVAEIVEHIWMEAVGEVERILTVPIQTIKIEEVEKAEALLIKIRDSLKLCEQENTDNKQPKVVYHKKTIDIKKILEEFYKSLPHRTESATDGDAGSLSWLSKKQDLCQLIKDMVSVSEATSFSMRPGVQVKYRALRCNILHVEPESLQHKQLCEDILSSVDRDITVNITKVYSIQRPIEDARFRHDLDNKRHLFHSSRVENFLGILSRGLLLPKVVVDDHGGTRTDAGKLGSGIYFASAASTSALYSTPSKTGATRMMLVTEVALGKCCDYLTTDERLTVPPEGYDSVHGVGRKHDNKSQFQDDEYVVYDVNQQRLRYLIEFTLNQEKPGAAVQVHDLENEVNTHLSSQLHIIDLKDVQGIADPLSKVQPGLVADKGDGQVELKAVHIRARLVDLAAQVIVLQEYHNKSSSAIEAKYVFPLGDGAAVCGFEAFINDKHIVGEVKEKETAHREYREAIRQGHGAYLMDQDEETPDVFTVSVGNLPPNATVLIKITYVAELQVEAELISFRLPGSVAPWKHSSATKEKTQDQLETHKVKGGQTSLQVAIEMPFDIRSVECPSNSVKIKQTASKAVVELRQDQDIQEGFQLLIGLAEIHVPRMWVERHPDNPDHQACMLTFYPEFEVGSEATTEVIILLDVSNSMQGTSLLSAKKIALLALLRFDPTWNFNVVLFGTRYVELFPVSQVLSEENIAKAQDFIQAAQADKGNTEVFRPLHAYFLLPPPDGTTRNMLLISDGHLNNETSVLADARSNYQHTRVFTFGVNATCNIYSLKALARGSAGAFEFFDLKVKSKWEEKVKRQLTKVGQPGLTSVAVEWRQYDENVALMQAPRQVTALFNGTRQVIYGFVPNCTMAFLSAVVGGQEVSTVVSTADLAITTGLVVHRLTAHAIIQDWEAGVLSDSRTKHEVAKMDEKENIISLSKEYSIVTQFTSFVAIEKRDKDEDKSSAKGPSIADLVQKEAVDILDYIGWPFELDEEQAKTDRVMIHVKTLTGKTVSLTASLQDTVGQLKQLFEDKEGVDVDQQRLVFNGQLLSDNEATLSNYNISNESELHMILRLRGYEPSHGSFDLEWDQVPVMEVQEAQSLKGAQPVDLSVRYRRRLKIPLEWRSAEADSMFRAETLDQTGGEAAAKIDSMEDEAIHRISEMAAFIADGETVQSHALSTRIHTLGQTSCAAFEQKSMGSRSSYETAAEPLLPEMSFSRVDDDAGSRSSYKKTLNEPLLTELHIIKMSSCAALNSSSANVRLERDEDVPQTDYLGEPFRSPEASLAFNINAAKPKPFSLASPQVAVSLQPPGAAIPIRPFRPTGMSTSLFVARGPPPLPDTSVPPPPLPPKVLEFSCVPPAETSEAIPPTESSTKAGLFGSPPMPAFSLGTPPLLQLVRLGGSAIPPKGNTAGAALFGSPPKLKGFGPAEHAVPSGFQMSNLVFLGGLSSALGESPAQMQGTALGAAAPPLPPPRSVTSSAAPQFSDILASDYEPDIIYDAFEECCLMSYSQDLPPVSGSAPMPSSHTAMARMKHFPRTLESQSVPFSGHYRMSMNTSSLSEDIAVASDALDDDDDEAKLHLELQGKDRKESDQRSDSSSPTDDQYLECLESAELEYMEDQDGVAGARTSYDCRPAMVDNDWKRLVVGCSVVFKGMSSNDYKSFCDLEEEPLKSTVDVDKVKGLMTANGLKSLGTRASEELQSLVATYLVFLLLFLSEHFDNNMEILHSFKQRGGADLASELAGLATRAALQECWSRCLELDRKYPLTCSTLELAPNWLTFCVMLLGI